MTGRARKPRSRILSVVYNDIRRDARVRRISEALAVEYEVTLISIAPRGAGPTPEVPFRVIELPIDHLGRFPRAKYVLFWFWSFMRGRSLSFDAVHCHDAFPLPVAAALARVRGTPLVYDAHELVDHVRERQTVIGRFWDIAHRRAVRGADLVITANRSRADFLVREGYHPRRSPVPVMNVGDGSVRISRSDGRSALAAVGVPPGVKVIIYQGYISERRHSVQLVEALSYLHSLVHLLLVGDGPAMPSVRQRVNECKLESRVHLTGYLPKDQVLQLVAGSDVGVVLYDDRVLNNYYCAPNKLFDYLGAGIAVVASDLPEPRRVLAGSDVGVLVEGGAPDMLADAIQRALGLNPRSADFGAILERFSWRREVEGLLEAYRRHVLPGATAP